MKQGRRPARSLELAQEIILGVALAGLRPAMEDRRLVQLTGQRKVPPQVSKLVFARRETAVVVEPGLAHCNDQRVTSERSDMWPVPIRFRGVVRVNAGGRLNASDRREHDRAA